MEELPAAGARLQSQHGLSEYDAGVLTWRAALALPEEVARAGDAKEASNWVTNEVQQGAERAQVEIGGSAAG